MKCKRHWSAWFRRCRIDEQHVGSGRLIRIAALVSCLLPPRAAAQSGGQADVAIQGYYMAGQQQSVNDTSGFSLHLQQFLPKFGLLDAVLEDYGSQGRWRQGENAVQLRGLPWLGYRWTLAGGDFRVSPLLVSNPFTNVYFPDLNLRGVEIESTRGNSTYSLFYGAQTLFQGPRIPFRIATGERAMGSTFNYHIGERLQFGLRLMRLTAEPNPSNTFLFPLNRRFSAVNNAAVQTLYRPFPELTLFAEASASAATGSTVNPVTPDRPLSFFAGAAYESSRITVRANYSDQGVFYLPVAGYYAGDRRGPFVELRLKPFRRLELFGSASAYRNNRSDDAQEPVYVSSSKSAGVSAELPGRFTLSGQANWLGFDSSDTRTATHSDNRQWTATLNRPLGRQNFRLTYRDMQFTTNGQVTRQVSREFEDLVQTSHLTIGGAVRLDSTIGTETRNTVFTRASAQLRLRRLTAYSYLDIGRDMVNRTVFSTNAITTSIFGVTAQLPSDWTLQAEAFRNSLSMTVNAANVFLLQSQGVIVPATFAGLDQWSLFIRANKQIHWGERLPQQALDRYTAERIPITGTVEGEVYEFTREGKRPVAGIPVTVDNSRLMLTNASGEYRMQAIPEGQHDIGLRIEEIPANFEPGPNYLRTVLINTRRTSRLDFEVIRLGQVCGRIQDAPDPRELVSVVIHLRPGTTYTTPNADGSFCFYNLRPGTYQIALDVASLPPLTRLDGPDSVPVQLDIERPPDIAEFRLRRIFESKPVRRKILPPSGGTSSHPPTNAFGKEQNK